MADLILYFPSPISGIPHFSKEPYLVPFSREWNFKTEAGGDYFVNHYLVHLELTVVLGQLYFNKKIF